MAAAFTFANIFSSKKKSNFNFSKVFEFARVESPELRRSFPGNDDNKFLRRKPSARNAPETMPGQGTEGGGGISGSW